MSGFCVAGAWKGKGEGKAGARDAKRRREFASPFQRLPRRLMSGEFSNAVQFKVVLPFESADEILEKVSLPIFLGTGNRLLLSTS